MAAAENIRSSGDEPDKLVGHCSRHWGVGIRLLTGSPLSFRNTIRSLPVLLYFHSEGYLLDPVSNSDSLHADRAERQGLVLSE